MFSFFCLASLDIY